MISSTCRNRSRFEESEMRVLWVVLTLTWIHVTHACTSSRSDILHSSQGLHNAGDGVPVHLGTVGIQWAESPSLLPMLYLLFPFHFRVPGPPTSTLFWTKTHSHSGQCFVPHPGPLLRSCMMKTLIFLLTHTPMPEQFSYLELSCSSWPWICYALRYSRPEAHTAGHNMSMGLMRSPLSFSIY